MALTFLLIALLCITVYMLFGAVALVIAFVGDSGNERWKRWQALCPDEDERIMTILKSIPMWGFWCVKDYFVEVLSKKKV